MISIFTCRNYPNNFFLQCSYFL